MSPRCRKAIQGKHLGGDWFPVPPSPMSCLSRNCRGLGNPQTEDDLVALVGNKDPKMIFLMETKCEKSTIERIGIKTQFSNNFVVLRVNNGGGLALLWKTDFQVDVQSHSERHIDVIIDHGVDDAWRFTGFYGDLDTASRENSWSLLHDLSSRFSLPWICLGDFNEILLAEEKQGWLDRPERQMQSFRDALDFCWLKDVGFSGFPFTWCNRRPRDHNVWVRLDRGVATVNWVLRFPSTRVHHLDAFHSDHKPLLLCTDSEFKRFYRKGCPFRFEAMWIKEESCESLVQDSWGVSNEAGLVMSFNKKIFVCQEKLKEWNRSTFGLVRNTLTKKLKELQLVEESGGYTTIPNHVYQLRSDIDKLKRREECMWKQRARTVWLKEGDQNTRYFHCRASQRNKRN